MKDATKQRVEEILSGSDAGAPAIEDLLRADPAGRLEIEAFASQSRMIRETLTPPEGLAPAPGFYARVMARVEAEQATSSFWDVFLSPFGYRLAYASLALIAILTLAIVTQPNHPPAEMAIEAQPSAQILTDPDPMVHLVGDSSEDDRGRVLMDLTAPIIDGGLQ